jgi:aspartate carbamoyltransferase regulatory subunit
MAEKSYILEVPGGEAPRLIQLLRNETSSLTANISWQGQGKIEFTPNERNTSLDNLLMKIRLVCPSSKIEEHDEGEVRQISGASVGTWIEGRIVACPNKNCVTVQPKEPTKPKFRIVSWKPVTLQCFYCGRYISEDAISQQLC